MNWLGRFFARRPVLAESARERLQVWRDLPEADPGEIALDGRYVVVDVESSGLDVSRDHLIAIGAVAVEFSRIALDAAFSVVLRQDAASDDDNILLHRIGGTSQLEGEEPVKALLSFMEFVGKSPLVAWHAPFDEIVIERAMRRYLGESFRRKWIDLAWLAPALQPQTVAAEKGLDDWFAACGIVNVARHNALADALATAQLFQVACESAREAGLQNAHDLFESARAQAWLARGKGL